MEEINSRKLITIFHPTLFVKYVGGKSITTIIAFGGLNGYRITPGMESIYHNYSDLERLKYMRDIILGACTPYREFHHKDFFPSPSNFFIR